MVFLKDENHLSLQERDRVQVAAEKAGVRLVEILPSKDICGAFNGFQGVFDTSPETARRLIDLGRKDAREALKEAGLMK